MLPALKKVDSGINEIFEVLQVNDRHFYPLWHFHPQFEIMLIESSTGTRYVGDNISAFHKGEITILGPNIPHLFRNHPEYYNEKNNRKARATVIYFSKEYFDSALLNLTEFARIRDLLLLSHRGILLKGKSRQKVAYFMKRVIKKTGVERYLGFIELLSFIANESDYEPLSSIGYSKEMINKSDVSLVNQIFDFLLNNFNRTIKLEEIAGIANMSPTTFCRYFKKKTNKTFISFLNEMRIGYACKLLIENTGMNISQICFESGFNNLTNFNIQFKKNKGISPQGFRSGYIKMQNQDL